MTLQLNYTQANTQGRFPNPNGNFNWKKFLEFLLLVISKLKEKMKII